MVRLPPSFTHVTKVATESVEVHSRVKLSVEGKWRKAVTLGGAIMEIVIVTLQAIRNCC